MNMRISRQSVYLLVIVLVLLVTVLLFAFLLLIPEGKAYREARIEMKSHAFELRRYEQWNEETTNTLQTLRSDNKAIISAFESSFDASRFIKKNESYFEDLRLAKVEHSADEEQFSIYEVNASSKIDSPQSFYSFLEGVNKSDWIIGIDFPIHFERVGALIVSSFKMKVYALKDMTKEE